MHCQLLHLQYESKNLSQLGKQTQKILRQLIYQWVGTRFQLILLQLILNVGYECDSVRVTHNWK